MLDREGGYEVRASRVYPAEARRDRALMTPVNCRTVVYSEEARSVQTNDDVDLTCTTLCHLDEAVGPVEVLPNTMYVHEWYCY